MTIIATVIADSQGPRSRLTTLALKYPRFIHSEFMTHRVFSRNASSSRAIPVERQIEMILEDTAMPIHWGKNQKGMKAEEENTAIVNLWDGMYPATAQEAWLDARDSAVAVARAFAAAGYHKQIVNRLLEPFAHISVLVTATEWDNFFELRRHPDAQPEIRALADAMYEAMEASRPVSMKQGWHLPYIKPHELESHPIKNLIRMSVARCARVSYTGHDGKPTTLKQDYDLYERLVNADPPHMSPAEHQAKVGVGHCSNFKGGWQQLRKMIEAGTVL